MIEPLVQAAAGIIDASAGYLRGVRELTRKYDVLLIADEVAVGFGRTGRMFACEHESVTPDLFCIAKGLTGGYLPMAATLSTDKSFRPFWAFDEAGRSFTATLTAAIRSPRGGGEATLDLFEEEQHARYDFRPKIARLRECSAQLAEHPHVGDIRQCGLIAGIDGFATGDAEPFPTQIASAAAYATTALRARRALAPLGETYSSSGRRSWGFAPRRLRIVAAVQRGIAEVLA